MQLAAGNLSCSNGTPERSRERQRLETDEVRVWATTAPGRSVQWSTIDTLVLAAVTVAAGAIRFVRLGTPDRYIWDEFYAQDACFYLGMPSSVCGTDQELTWTHPPLGKWLIALGIQTFGYTPFGWRVAAAAMGTLAVTLLYLLARKIFHSRLAAATAAVLLAIDWLHFAQSRTAMVDVFLSTFGIAALLFIACDRDRLAEAPATREARPKVSALDRPWRFAAGIVVGAAVATKWSGWLMLFGVVSLTLAWEIGARRASHTTHAFRRTLKEEWPSIVIAYAGIPLLIYLISYAGHVHNSVAGNISGPLFTWPWAEGGWIREFARRQVQMFRFHRTLVGVHLYASAGWTWPLLKRPALFFFGSSGNSYREILAAGNPLVWWPALAAFLYIVASWVRRRDFTDPHGLILVSFAANYVPWIYLSRLRQFGFMYYMVPAIPSMCLALAFLAVRARTSRVGRLMLGVGLAIAVVLFVFYYPILSAVPVSRSFWELHIPFRDCQGAVEPGFRGGPPPPGWCWI
jgi:dolichyl-phosphate-mannose-protein mannosyltransferase